MCAWWLQLFTSKNCQVGWYSELSNLEWSSVRTLIWSMVTLACLLQDFQLTALNSWLASHGATYRSTNGDSRIDFILTRHRDADNMAKQVGLLDVSPFLPTGPHHIPMMTSLNYKYYRPPRHHCDRSNNTASMLSGRTHCTGRNMGMVSTLHYVHLRHLHHWMIFTLSLSKVPSTTFSHWCKAGLMPLTHMLWPSGNIIMHLNFLVLLWCPNFFTNGGIAFCSGRWSVNRPDTHFAWNIRGWIAFWKKPNLPMKDIILLNCIKSSTNITLGFVPNVSIWRVKMTNFLRLWKRLRQMCITLPPIGLALNLVIHRSLHLMFPLLSLSLKKPLLRFLPPKLWPTALHLVLFRNHGPIFLLDGCTSSLPIGRAPHHLLSRRLGRTPGHVGFPNLTNLQSNLLISGCWDCKSHWAKQRFKWWPIRPWKTLLTNYGFGHSLHIYLTGRPVMLCYVLLLITRQFVIYWYFKKDLSINPLHYNHVLHVWVAYNCFWIWPGLSMLYLDLSWLLHFPMFSWLLNCKAFFLLDISVSTVTLKSTTLQGASLWAGALGKGAV